MKILLLILLVILFISQLTLMPRLAIFGVFPNILLAAILILAVKFGENLILFAAFLSGLALDLFSGLPFGVWTISFLAVIWLLENAGKRFFKNSDFSGQACLIGGALMFFIVFQPFLIKVFSWFGLGTNLSFWQNILRVGWVEFVLDFITALILLFILNRLYGLRRRI